MLNEQIECNQLISNLTRKVVATIFFNPLNTRLSGGFVGIQESVDVKGLNMLEEMYFFQASDKLL